MDVADLGALREIEARLTGQKTLKPPPRPVHHPATAKASQHPLPHGPFIKSPRVVRKKKPVAQEDVGDKLLGYIKHVNRVHG